MKTEKTRLSVVFLITPRRIAAARGCFSQTWSRRGLAAAGAACDFLDDNHSWSVVLGIHPARAVFLRWRFPLRSDVISDHRCVSACKIDPLGGVIGVQF